MRDFIKSVKSSVIGFAFICESVQQNYPQGYPPQGYQQQVPQQPQNAEKRNFVKPALGLAGAAGLGLGAYGAYKYATDANTQNAVKNAGNAVANWGQQAKETLIGKPPEIVGPPKTLANPETTSQTTAAAGVPAQTPTSTPVQDTEKTKVTDPTSTDPDIDSFGNPVIQL